MADVESIEKTLILSDKMSADIRYADDTTLISAMFEKLQLSTLELEAACKKWGIKINSSKTKLITTVHNDEIIIDGNTVEKTDSFVYLGNVIPNTSDDINRRTALASQAFGRLKSAIWSNRNLSMPLKIRLYNALIIPIATYASETWTLKQNDIRTLNTFEMRCLRSILGVTLWDRLTNVTIRNRTGLKMTIIEVIQRKRRKWFGNVVRRNSEGYINKLYIQNFTGKRHCGHPRKRWKDQLREDLNLPLQTLERIAKDRDQWRNVVSMGGARILRGLCR